MPGFGTGLPSPGLRAEDGVVTWYSSAQSHRRLTAAIGFNQSPAPGALRGNTGERVGPTWPHKQLVRPNGHLPPAIMGGQIVGGTLNEELPTRNWRRLQHDRRLTGLSAPALLGNRQGMKMRSDCLRNLKVFSCEPGGK